MRVDRPRRKSIRLQNFDYSQNKAYFVTICIHNRQPLFGEIVGATLCGRPNRPDLMVEKWLREIGDKYENTKLYDYIIMPDHIHFVIGLTGDHAGSPLPDIIRWFKTMTANEYIRGVKGGLYLPFEDKFWQRSFFDHIVRCEDDMFSISEYIKKNPLIWQIKNAAPTN